MFGLFKSCDLNRVCKSNWKSHYCGTCIALKQNYGSIYRLLLNNDSVLLSLLSSTHQNEDKIDHHCILRKKRRTKIINPALPASRYSALISVLVASVKLRDSAEDKDGFAMYFGSLTGRLSEKLRMKAEFNAGILGIQLGHITKYVTRQFEREKICSDDFLYYSSPTETAAGMTFANTTLLSGKHEDRMLLDSIGRLYGRIIYLLDSFRDYNSDAEKGKFNPFNHITYYDGISNFARDLFSDSYNKMLLLADRLSATNGKVISEFGLVPVLNSGCRILAMSDINENLQIDSKGKKDSCFDSCDCCCCDCLPCCDDCDSCDCCGCDC